jgi:hypothetical protein
MCMHFARLDGCGGAWTWDPGMECGRLVALFDRWCGRVVQVMDLLVHHPGSSKNSPSPSSEQRV